MKKKYIILNGILCLISLSLIAQSPKQPPLGTRSATLIQSQGLNFKDLNKNGKLDAYEDWRLSNDKRAKNLLSLMSLEEKVGFMLISTARMKNDRGTEPGAAPAPITSDFNEEDQVQKNNMFTRKPLPVEMMMSAGSSKGVKDFHLRHFILRANAPAKTMADWANKLQALCEAEPLGIPAIIASNPRNHITRDASVGLSVGKNSLLNLARRIGFVCDE